MVHLRREYTYVRVSGMDVPILSDQTVPIMKIYSFAPISARDYPTVKILDHPFIWSGVQFCVNLSEKPYTQDLVDAMAAHGIEWIHFPLSEKIGASWWETYAIVLPKLFRAFLDGEKMIVHCDFGANRSRTLIEAFYYMLTGEEFLDEHKGEINHLAYNCKQHHFPPLEETERMIKELI